MTYCIKYNGVEFAATELEKGDAPMGVASGRILPTTQPINFHYLKKISNDPDITVYEMNDEFKFVNMNVSKTFSIHKSDGSELECTLGINITGMDDDWFDISALGIPYPFYEQEFPHHVKSYHEQFDDVDE